MFKALQYLIGQNLQGNGHVTYLLIAYKQWRRNWCFYIMTIASMFILENRTFKVYIIKYDIFFFAFPN